MSWSLAPVSFGAYSDVDSAQWFYQDVCYVTDKELMKGMSDGGFSPYLTMTRAMIITVLYRMAGEPAVSGSCPFSDVPRGIYYENAVIWASENGITSGVTPTRFEPDQTVIREQIAAFLYRYTGYMGGNTGSRTGLSGFKDASEVSAYAREAMEWAVATGIIQGVTADTINPNGYAQRAQVAAMIHRYCEGGGKAPAPSPSPDPSRTDSAPAFVISDVTVSAGQKNVPVTIAVRNNPGIASIGMTVRFPNQLKLASVVYSSDIGGESIQPGSLASPLKLVWVSPFSDVAGDWVFVTLSFDVDAAAKAGTQNISISYDPDDVYDLAETNIAFATVGGSVTIR